MNPEALSPQSVELKRAHSGNRTVLLLALWFLGLAVAGLCGWMGSQWYQQHRPLTEQEKAYLSEAENLDIGISSCETKIIVLAQPILGPYSDSVSVRNEILGLCERMEELDRRIQRMPVPPRLRSIGCLRADQSRARRRSFHALRTWCSSGDPMEFTEYANAATGAVNITVVRVRAQAAIEKKLGRADRGSAR